MSAIKASLKTKEDFYSEERVVYGQKKNFHKDIFTLLSGRVFNRLNIMAMSFGLTTASAIFFFREKFGNVITKRCHVVRFILSEKLDSI